MNENREHFITFREAKAAFDKVFTMPEGVEREKALQMLGVYLDNSAFKQENPMIIRPIEDPMYAVASTFEELKAQVIATFARYSPDVEALRDYVVDHISDAMAKSHMVRNGRMFIGALTAEAGPGVQKQMLMWNRGAQNVQEALGEMIVRADAKHGEEVRTGWTYNVMEVIEDPVNGRKAESVNTPERKPAFLKRIMD